MECQKCKSTMVGKLSMYCPRCGYMANGNMVNPNKVSEVEIEKETLRLFIGNNADNIFGISNWGAFLFGSLYFLYRKCYLFGFISLLFESLCISLIIHNPMILICLLLLKFIIYWSFSEKKGYMIGYTLLVIIILLLIFLVNAIEYFLIIILIVEGFIWFSFGNAIYIKTVKNKISKLDKNNIKLLKKKGNVSIILPLIGIGLMIIIHLFYSKLF